jgi:hypothetical protein
MIETFHGQEHLGLGIPLSFLTLPPWWYVLQGV